MKLVFPIQKARRSPALITPRAYADVTARGLQLPSKALVCPFSLLAKTITAQGTWKRYFLSADVYCADSQDFCFVTGFGCGGPAVALVVEQLIALGVREMFFIGLAGSLQEEVQPGDMVLCNQSICGDGTSARYVRQETVCCDKTLQHLLARVLRAEQMDFHTGRNWSTDTLFRETKAEIKHYQQRSVLTVDMETSTFLAVCKRRHIRGAAAFVVSDVLHTGKWSPDLSDPLIWKNLRQLAQTGRFVLGR